MSGWGATHDRGARWSTRSLLQTAVLFLPFLLLGLAQDDSSGGTAEGTTISRSEALEPSGPYTSYTSTLHASDVASAPGSSGTGGANATGSAGDPGATDDRTDLVGTRTLALTTFLGNETMTTTSAAATPEPTNTQPCNGHVEFCTRLYSNVTYVAAHNSPFVREGSAAANQRYGVTEQLNDGIRLLQGQMHLNDDGVPHMCHSSCDILDAGPLTDWLAQIKAWLDTHRFDVVTVLIGNAWPYPDPSTFVSYIESSGITDYAYHAPQMPMGLGDWPTLAEMMILNKRVVIQLDYKADFSRWPWLLDEFGVQWETPFDPLDRTFPCNVSRPPDLPDEDARYSRMFLMNHNLNVNFTLLGTSILVPARSLLNETNAVSGEGSLGMAAEQCRNKWGRPPNFVNVDYYDEGSSPGSVFQVAAMMNGVEYTGQCCGIESAGSMEAPDYYGAWIGVLAAFAAFFLM